MLGSEKLSSSRKLRKAKLRRRCSCLPFTRRMIAPLHSACALSEQIAKFGMTLDVFADVPTERNDLQTLFARILERGLHHLRREAAAAQGRRRQRVKERHDAGRKTVLRDDGFAINVELEALFGAVMDNGITHGEGI